MKQTKLREPILYTTLWVVSVVILIAIGNHKINIYINALLVFIFRLSSSVSSGKWLDRYKTRDMKKYILGKIKDIEKQIEDLQEEKEEILLSIKD